MEYEGVEGNAFLMQLVKPTVSSLTPSGSCISLGESGSFE